ncbi:hypothetical protein J2W35_006455 [Variovorax boronicumulans]|uniref:hypothetical protein n=1 Tax=Variovorax boronicumulans TaxID=436515 RepID=UPI002788ED80|nr:hypothetical protein [Variovorax boronicumulans]MDQ0086074.1 hypothetical protein [Variovorax boronicumulans]
MNTTCCSALPCPTFLRRSWSAIRFVGFFLWLVVAGGAMAQSGDLRPPLEGGSSSANALEMLAAKSGIENCLKAARSFGPSLAGPLPLDVVALMSHPVAPDAATFSMSIERSESGGTRFVSATFAPTLRGGCDLSYEVVETWPKSCQAFAAEDLKQPGRLAQLGRAISVVVIGPNHHMYLMPTSSGGCVSVNKEVVYP